MSPTESDDLSEASAEVEGALVLLRSSAAAEHDPDYRVIATFPIPSS